MQTITDNGEPPRTLASVETSRGFNSLSSHHLKQGDCHHSVTRIPLRDGSFALVDASDLPLLDGHKWFEFQSHRITYAHSTTDGFMHRILMGLTEGDPRRVDHRDGNGLNNRRNNLRICTPTQNRANARKFAATASRFKGVTRGPGGQWRVYVGTRENRRYLGLFGNEIEGARAYDAAALELFGDFACLNFPDPNPLSETNL